jgi:Domain of unknown function (DUF1841)
MPFFENQSREQLRQMYLDAWQRRRDGLPLEPLQAQIAAVIDLHPEYHAMLQGPEAPARDYTPQAGESNPFLHMGLHLAVRDQLATDRPGGIRRAFETLAARAASSHDAEHQLIECLAETLWEAQRAARPPDEQAYLTRVARLAERRA